jgi:hypothetical protein
MNFETWVSHMNESVKEDELNRILDKMSDGKTLTEIEKKFLSMFSKTDEDDYKDFQYLTKNDAFEKIKNILSEGRKIICDLYEKNKVGIEIVSVYNQFDSESCYIVLKDDERIELKDNYLYNIVYDIKKDEYSLQSQDQYYEKIPIKDEN